MKRLGLALITTLICTSAHAENPPDVANFGFEQLLPNGTPASWFLSQTPGVQSLTSDKGLQGKGGRLRVSGGSAAVGTVAQSIDPAPYRGKRIRLSVALRPAGPAQAGPFLTVLRPDPYKMSFVEDQSNRPAAAGKWQKATITGWIASDATAIWIGVKAVGEADVTIDNVRLDVLKGNSKPPSPKALAYLDKAIELLRAHHINSAKADWPRLIAEAHAEIAGAKTSADTYPAIRNIIVALGERHTFLMPPPSQSQIEAAAKAGPSGVVAGTEMPTSALLDGRVGVVRLPGLDTFSPGGEERARTYPSILRTALEQLDKAPLCGWIVDLRNNSGGNMWPMLAGLDPLLGQPPFGFFVSNTGDTASWSRSPDGIGQMAAVASQSAPAFALEHAAAPLAVLIGSGTTSSGEMTAIALIGRPGVRTFGGASGGYLSGNAVRPLPDGAHIAVTEVLIRDRTGKDYADVIQPDVLTNPDAAEQAAKAWIEQQCGR